MVFVMADPGLIDAVESIRAYAQENKLSGESAREIFHAGVAAKCAMRHVRDPDLYASIDGALAAIREYATKHGMTGEQVAASFEAGWFAASALRKDWRKPDADASLGDPEQRAA